MGGVDAHPERARATEIVIRAVRPDEIERLGELTVAAYRTLDIDIGDYRAMLADVADRVAHAEVLVAVDGDRLLGGVTYVGRAGTAYAEFTDADAAGIRMLAVDPGARGRGIGAALVRACVTRARASGRGRIVLHTTPAMTSAQGMYRRLGFVRAPARDWDPQPGILLLGYELVLDDT
ncbi:MAG TPA: GNAT family N-acetyltransferase [Euzebyales bacterium]|nr:GNAT family N-acetyltransferase [Euzebyales bacterium]